MQQHMLHEKYPVYVAEVAKTETSFKNVEEITAYYKACIAENPKVQLIGVFDHFAHTQRIQGPIAPAIQAAVDIVFCFGFALPNPEILAVRPRSIGVADMGDHFAISFMEAPMQPANEAMERWTKALRNV
jgi:hypothetical protein